MDSECRPRRTCMSVPASSGRFLARARHLPADEVMLDLEDSVAPDAKAAARALAVAALKEGGWDGKLMAVRVNDVTTPWAYQDVIAVLEGAPGAVAASAAALGYDGKWVLHPAQVPVVNEAFTPSVEEYWRALGILAAYDRATSVDQRGAVMLGGEMIDEASRKMAQALVARGEAAGLPRPAA